MNRRGESLATLLSCSKGTSLDAAFVHTATLLAGALEPLDQVLRSEKIESVRRALESQPAVYREILSRRFEEEMKLEEIAEVLSVPLRTAKTRLARALERLRTASLHMQQEEVSS